MIGLDRISPPGDRIITRKKEGMNFMLLATDWQPERLVGHRISAVEGLSQM